MFKTVLNKNNKKERIIEVSYGLLHRKSGIKDLKSPPGKVIDWLEERSPQRSINII